MIDSAGSLETMLKIARDDHARCEQAASADPADAQRQRDLAVSHIKLARIQREMGNVVDALAELRAGRAIMAKLVDLAPDNAQWVRDLAGFEREIATLEGGPAPKRSGGRSGAVTAAGVLPLRFA